jgi:hypothetical protein
MNIDDVKEWINITDDDFDSAEILKKHFVSIMKLFVIIVRKRLITPYLPTPVLGKTWT